MLQTGLVLIDFEQLAVNPDVPQVPDEPAPISLDCK
jgi:hypothetical protein